MRSEPTNIARVWLVSSRQLGNEITVSLGGRSSRMRIAFQDLLNLQGEAVHAAAQGRSCRSPARRAHRMGSGSPAQRHQDTPKRGQIYVAAPTNLATVIKLDLNHTGA
jgi:hypothetical protein